jgi:hypothetical protein
VNILLERRVELLHNCEVIRAAVPPPSLPPKGGILPDVTLGRGNKKSGKMKRCEQNKKEYRKR